MAAIEKTKIPMEEVWERRERNLARFREAYTAYDRIGSKFQGEVQNVYDRPENAGCTMEGRVIRGLWTSDTHHSVMRYQYFCMMMTDYGVSGSDKPSVAENFNKMKRILTEAIPKRINPTKSKWYEEDIRQIFAKPEGEDDAFISSAAGFYNARHNKLEKMQFACRTMLESVKETGDVKQDTLQKEIAMSKMRAFLGEICPPVMLRSEKLHVQSDGALTSKPTIA